MLYHFRGSAGAKTYLEALKQSGNPQYAQQILDEKYPSKGNMPVEQYLQYYYK